MILKVLFLVLFLNIIDEASSKEQDDYEYLKSHKALYKYQDVEYDFPLAALICLSEGAVLYYPESMDEATDIFNSIVPENITQVTIGIHNDIWLNKLIALDGGTKFFENFEIDMPSLHPSKSVVLKRNLTVEASDAAHNFVCKKQQEASLFRESDDYITIEAFEAQYKFVPTSFYKYSTILKCLSDGAELYYPESSEEAKEVYNTIVPKNVNNIMVGIHNILRQGYISLDGSSEFFVNWDTDQPLSNHDWVSIDRNITYTSSSSAYLPGVCKKKLRHIYEGDCQSSSFGYKFHGGLKAYKFHKESVTWFEANRICMEENALLAAPLIPIKYGSISPLITNIVKFHCKSFTDVWGGFKKLNSEYTDLKDEELPKTIKQYNGFNEYYPLLDEGCGVHKNNSHYAVLRCNLKRPFVCEINPAIQNYYYFKSVNVLYEFSPQPMTWSDARFYCKDQDARLAMPRNKKQMDVLVDEMLKKDVQAVYLGFHSRHGEGLFTTLYGSMAIPSDLKWAPNRHNLTKSCGGMNEDGLLVGKDCEEYLYFFCEFYKENKKVRDFF